jgi:DNA-3-methyladenine glycosylase I
LDYNIKKKRKLSIDFDYSKVALYSEDKIQELMQNTGIIRNQLKIRSAVSNAISFMKIQEEFGSFSKYIWGFVDEKPVINYPKTLKEITATTPLSDAISKDLKKRGFKFIGSTVVYAHMQATGMVNDHVEDCWKRS